MTFVMPLGIEGPRMAMMAMRGLARPTGEGGSRAGVSQSDEHFIIVEGRRGRNEC